MDDLKLITSKVNDIFSPHEVWAVGGSVRDALLGRPPKDFDFTTALPPDDIESYIKAAGRHCNPRGKRFGTLGFKVELRPHQFVEVEVTTFRREQYTAGSRHPSVVEFVDDLMEDLSRRDFTINAIAYRDGLFFDPFGGRLDILACKIKAVGEATDRFKDDPLRMLRAARFAAQLGFEIDPNMIGKARKMSDKILTVSRERWMLELDKLLVQDDWLIGLDTLYSTDVLRFMLPEVWRLYTGNYTMPWDEAEIDHDVAVRWAALLGYVGRVFSPVKIDKREVKHWPNQSLVSLEIAKGIAERLKWSNDRKKAVFDAIEHYK